MFVLFIADFYKCVVNESYTGDIKSCHPKASDLDSSDNYKALNYTISTIDPSDEDDVSGIFIFIQKINRFIA